jgi:predicted nucleic acid-binding protein
VEPIASGVLVQCGFGCLWEPEGVVKSVFVDTLYWVAVLRPNDPYSAKARRVKASLGHVELVTTEEVLVECLGFVAGAGRHVRQVAAAAMQEILTSKDVTVVPQSHDSFLAGLKLYERRLDKGYSLVDCISMNAMRSRGIDLILTDDHHFAQEGLRPLL